MTITLTPDVAAALAEKAKQEGTTPEALAAETLREYLLLPNSAPSGPRTPGLGAIQRRQLRTPGLSPGVFQPSDDFDDPLPDSFWLGQE